MERLTSKRATLLGIGTWQYVKDVFYVNLNQNRRKVKVEGVYVDVINIYALWWYHPPTFECGMCDMYINLLAWQLSGLGVKVTSHLSFPKFSFVKFNFFRYKSTKFIIAILLIFSCPFHNLVQCAHHLTEVSIFTSVSISVIRNSRTISGCLLRIRSRHLYSQLLMQLWQYDFRMNHRCTLGLKVLPLRKEARV